MNKIPQHRSLFRALSLTPGQKLTVYTGTPVLLIATHWTDSGPMLCSAYKALKCENCQSGKTSRRIMVLIPVRTTTGAEYLWIASPLAIAWASATAELEGQELEIERSAKNKLSRSTRIKQHAPWPARTHAWAATLLRATQEEIAAASEYQS